MAKRSAPKRRWCMTLNNPTEEEAEFVKHYFGDNYTYGIVGKEKDKERPVGFTNMVRTAFINSTRRYLTMVRTGR